MNTTITLSKDNDLLQETATRLIKALGVEMAIFICRSNYWHGVMQLILDREEGSVTPAENVQVSRTAEPIRLHSLPRTTAKSDHRHDDFNEIAIAA